MHVARLWRPPSDSQNIADREWLRQTVLYRVCQSYADHDEAVNSPYDYAHDGIPKRRRSDRSKEDSNFISAAGNEIRTLAMRSEEIQRAVRIAADVQKTWLFYYSSLIPQLVHQKQEGMSLLLHMELLQCYHMVVYLCSKNKTEACVRPRAHFLMTLAQSPTRCMLASSNMNQTLSGMRTNAR